MSIQCIVTHAMATNITIHPVLNILPLCGVVQLCTGCCCRGRHHMSSIWQCFCAVCYCRSSGERTLVASVSFGQRATFPRNTSSISYPARVLHQSSLARVLQSRAQLELHSLSKAVKHMDFWHEPAVLPAGCQNQRRTASVKGNTEVSTTSELCVIAVYWTG
jgi:hypothetical protein